MQCTLLGIEYNDKFKKKQKFRMTLLKMAQIIIQYSISKKTYNLIRAR